LRLWAKAWLDGEPAPLAYQPQHLWSDGTFEMWANLGEPTSSKRVTRERLAIYLALHPGEKVRVLKIVSATEVVDVTDFLPNGEDDARPLGAVASGAWLGKPSENLTKTTNTKDA
jgi:hypothetical protein